MNKEINNWLDYLEQEDLNFVKQFVLSSGSLKEMATIYGVTYPTLRIKLDKLIQKIRLTESNETDNYILLIKKLAIEDKIDFDAAKLLINSYRKEGGKVNGK
ncbi:MAG: DUF2089 family protein [Acholeplasma sp.]|nr:DUF2089 family protein [Acholeplasma sp.]